MGWPDLAKRNERAILALGFRILLMKIIDRPRSFSITTLRYSVMRMGFVSGVWRAGVYKASAKNELRSILTYFSIMDSTADRLRQRSEASARSSRIGRFDLSSHHLI